MSIKSILIIGLSLFVITKVEAATVATPSSSDLGIKPGVKEKITEEVCTRALQYCISDFKSYQEKRAKQNKPLDEKTTLFLQTECAKMYEHCLKRT